MAIPQERPEIRDIILDAADRVLGRLGYRKMSMEDIAREARLSRRTLYLHFTNKEDIALCSNDRIVDRLLERLRAIAQSDESPTEKVRQMLLTRVLFRFDSIQIYSRSIDEMITALRPAYLARRDQYVSAEAEIVMVALQEGKRQGDFRVDDLAATARTLLLATSALFAFSLSEAELHARDTIESQAQRLTALLLDGLRRRSER